MKSKNMLLVIAVLVSNSASMQAMLSTRARQVASGKIVLGKQAKPSDISTVNIPVNRPSESKSPFGPKGQQVRSYSQQRSGVEYDLDSSDWKVSAHPFQRSLMSYVPFTQAYSMYQKKYNDLAQFRYLMDKWENILCQKYASEKDKNNTIATLLTDMNSFDLANISRYKKEVFIYTAALVNSYLAWSENNKGVDTNGILEILLNYMEMVGGTYLNSIGANHLNFSVLASEYPFFRTLGMRFDPAYRESRQKEYEEAREWQRQEDHRQYEQRQERQRQQEQELIDRQSEQSIYTLLSLPQGTSYGLMKKKYFEFLNSYHPDRTKSLVASGQMTQQEASRRENFLKSVNPAWEKFEKEQKAKAGNRE